jgi:threonine/homoserine/homoserine lactone efflux protein
MLTAFQLAARDIWPFASSYLLLLAVPGPNFAVVAQAGVSGSARSAVSAALAASGSLAMLQQEDLRGLSHLVFAAILAFAGSRALTRAFHNRAPLPAREGASARRQFGLGFGTAVSNPLTAGFFASSAVSLGAAGAQMRPDLLALTVFVVAMSWFGMIGCMLSVQLMRRLYGQCWRILDGGLGVLLVMAGLSSAWAGFTS